MKIFNRLICIIIFYPFFKIQYHLSKKNTIKHLIQLPVRWQKRISHTRIYLDCDSIAVSLDIDRS